MGRARWLLGVIPFAGMIYGLGRWLSSSSTPDDFMPRLTTLEGFPYQESRIADDFNLSGASRRYTLQESPEAIYKSLRAELIAKDYEEDKKRPVVIRRRRFIGYSHTFSLDTPHGTTIVTVGPSYTRKDPHHADVLVWANHYAVVPFWEKLYHLSGSGESSTVSDDTWRLKKRASEFMTWATTI